MATKQITRNIVLTPHFDALIKRKVASGLYQSASEVISDALRLVEERDLHCQSNPRSLKDEIERGITQIENGDLHDGAAVFNEIRNLSKSYRDSLPVRKHKESKHAKT